MQQNNNNKIISTFEIIFSNVLKKIVGRPMVHYNCIIVDIRHLINLKWLALV